MTKDRPTAHQHESRRSGLDPDLLFTPFEVQTNWHVLTGTACTGKTTLIDMLADRGFRTVPEMGRRYIEQELASGRSIEEIFSDETTERAIGDMQLRAEQGLRATDMVFLDRGMPDLLTFYRWQGMDPNEILPSCFRHCYASVFVLDRLSLQLDGARVDDEAFTNYLDEWLYRDYCALGYHVVRVPVMPPLQRLAFVLERLVEQVLISPQS